MFVCLFASRRNTCAAHGSAESKEGTYERKRRHHLRAGRLSAGQWRIPHSPNHPGHDLQIPVERTDEPTVRPVRIRLLLHPPAESDQRHRRREDLRAGRRRRSNAHLIRPGGEFLRSVQHLQQRRPHRRFLRHLWRHVQPHQRDHAQDGCRMHIRKPGLHRRGA